MRTVIFLSAALLTGLLLSFNASADVAPGMAKATFVVHCYTVGVNALQGKPGVVAVKPGWSGAREVDRVIYDPELVTLEELEGWLKGAGTYVSTLEHTLPETPLKEMSK